MKGSVLSKISLFCSALFALTLTACDLDADMPAPIPAAYVLVYHGSPDAPALDILFDNQIINNKGYQYATFSGYHQFEAGNRNFKFKEVNSANALIDSTFALHENKAYSLFVVNRLQAVELLVVEDILKEPATGKAGLRIIHLSPDAPAVDVSTAGATSTELATNLSFKGKTIFKEISSGRQTVQVKANGTSDVALTVSDYLFESGRVYTLLIRGLSTQPADNTNQLSAQLIRNY